MPPATRHGNVADMGSEEKAEPPGLVRCPGCAALTRPGWRPDCPSCGAWLAGPQAAELWQIAAELARLDQARQRLEVRREVLLAGLWPERRAENAAVGPPGGRASLPAAPGSARQAALPQAAGTAGARPEVSRAAAANLLLAVGGLLVMIAAGVFTAANWSVLGPGGRAAILLATSALTLAAPWPLTRRGLTATAESVTATGLAMTAAAAYLAGQLVPTGRTSDLAFAAVAAAVLAAAWAAYGAVAPPKGPQVAAIGLAQFPVPLAAAAAFPSVTAVALALVLTACGDIFLVRWVKGKNVHSKRLALRASAASTWVLGVVLANAMAFGSLGWRQSWQLSSVFAVAAVTGILGAPAMSDWVPARWVTGISGVLTAIGLGLPAVTAVPSGWQVGVFAAAGAAVAATAGLGNHRGRARPLAAGGAAVLGAAGLWVTPAALFSMVYPLDLIGAGPSHFAGDGLIPASAWHGSPATPCVLALVALACWWLPAVNRSVARAAAVTAAGVAASTIPVTPGVSATVALVVVTMVAAVLLAIGAVVTDRIVAGTAASAGLVVAGNAVAWSVTRPVITLAGWSLAGRAVPIAELSAAAVMLAAAATAARARLPLVLATAGTVATSAGLACAVAQASGLSTDGAALAVLGVAAGAAGTATLLRRARVTQALTLDLCAGPLAMLAAAMAASNADIFAVVATATAAMASGTAWARAGARRSIALGVAVLATVAAIGSQARPLVSAAFFPYHHFIRPWHAIPQTRAGAPGWVAAGWPGMPLAIVVLTACAIIAVVAAGAWRGGRGSADALAVALPVVAAPAGAAAGLSCPVTVGLLLGLTLALTAWAAVSRSLAPAGAAMAAAWLTLTWALAGAVPTLVVLGFLTAAYPLCAWRARLPRVRAGAAVMAVIAGGALAGCSALAAGLPAWQAGLAVLATAALAQLTAAHLARASRPAERAARGDSPAWDLAGAARLAERLARGDSGTRDGTRALSARRFTDAHSFADLPSRAHLSVAEAVEASGWLTATAGALLGFGTPWHASIALAVTAVLCLGVALRPRRRPLLWVGLALSEAALSVWLAAMGIYEPEPYTVPASAILAAFGRRHRRHWRRAGSWATYGPGLAIVLLPSLIVTWQNPGWLRPLLLGAGAAAVTLAGGRARLQAPLLLGATVTVLDAGHELAPMISHFAGMLPRWVPIAVVGVLLLGVGATYEARLRDLVTLTKAVGKMH